MKFVTRIILFYGCLCFQLSAQTANLNRTTSDSLLINNTISQSQSDNERIKRQSEKLFRANTLDQLTISRLPVRGLQSYMLIQPGVQEQNGIISIRGGSDQGIGYFVGQSMIMNHSGGGPPAYFIPEALSEVQVFTGGQSARYGLATSGLVFSELKSGSGKINLGINLQTDKLASEGEQFLGTYSYQDQIVVATFGGTAWDERFRFFAAGENVQSGDWIKRYSTGFTFNDLVDINPQNQDVINGIPDTVSLNYPNGFTSGNSLDHSALNSRLDFVLDKFQIKLIGMYFWQKKYDLDIPMLDILNTRKFYVERKNTFFSGVFSHQLSESFDYDITASFYKNYNERFDDYFGNNWQAWSDSVLISEYTGGDVTYRSRWRPPNAYRLLGIHFNRNGTLNGRYFKEEQQSRSLEAMMNLNLIKGHRITSGVFWMDGSNRRYEISSTVMGIWEDYNFSENVPAYIISNYLRSSYGYDVFGNELNNGLGGPLEQQIFSAFAEDYFKMGQLKFQIGARMDYLKDTRRYLRNPANPYINPETNTIDASEWIEKDGVWEFSPRFAVEFPINDKISTSVSYARFVQSSLMVSPGMQEPLSSRLIEANFIYMHKLFNIDLTGFSKNLNGNPSITNIDGYYSMDSGSSAAIRGLELRFALHRIGRFQTGLNYTLTDSEGTTSDGPAYYGAVYRGTQTPTISAPLEFVQSHQGNLILDYRFEANDGGPILERSGINILFSLNSGHPYTKSYSPPGGQADAYSAGVVYMSDTRSRAALESSGSSQTPWNYNLDLRLDKTFNIFQHLTMNIYLRVLNVLNTKNVINVYPNTGSAYDDGYISDPARYESNVAAYGPEYLDLYRALNSENSQAYWDITGNQMYGKPRQIFLGIQMAY